NGGVAQMTCTQRMIALITINGIGLFSQDQLTRLAPANKPETNLNYDSRNKPVPKWENGYFLAYDLEPDNAPVLYVFDSAGEKLFRTSLAFDGVARFTPSSVAA